MSLEAFKEDSRKVISAMRDYPSREVTLVHHDDADGLCSAAIIKAALEREGYRIKSLCLEKAYPEVLESLHKVSGGIIIYADIGSAHADMISRFNEGRNLTVILDHHNPKPAGDQMVHDLNLENYGFRGEEDFSGSTCCYLFSKLLNEENATLSYLALVGSHEIPVGIKGLNKLVLEEALNDGVVEAKRNKLRIKRFGIAIDRMFSMLQVLGSVGYYTGGPEAGIKACLEGISDTTKRMVQVLEERRKSINRRVLGMLYRRRLRETEHIQWFDVGDMYRGMGSKVIGQFCSFLSYQRKLIKQNKYIIGVMNLQNDIPGWGRLSGTLAKASIRAPKALRQMIDEGEVPSAVDLLTEASKGFGVADGHEYAANVVMPRNMKVELIERAEEVVSNFRTTSQP